MSQQPIATSAHPDPAEGFCPLERAAQERPARLDRSEAALASVSSARQRWLIPALLLLVFVLLVTSLVTGKVALSLDIWNHTDPIARVILLELRVPRALLGVIVGAALGLAGAATQGYLRNPLAEPGTLGVSPMAALGAVLSIFFGFAGMNPWALPLCGVAGGMLGMLLLFFLAGATASLITLVLAGVFLSALAVAGISLVLSLSTNPWAAGEILRWMLGALTDRSLDDLMIAAPMVAAGAALILSTRRSLDALTLGESGARSLGIDLGRTQWLLCAGVGLAVGGSVAVTGVIGFVGLIVPHLLRPLIGARPSALLLPSAIGGAALVLAGDVLVRLLPGGSELQLSVVMSLVGAPFFFALLYSLRRRLT